MQVSVESTGNIERKLTIVIPADRVDSEVETRLKSMHRAQNARHQHLKLMQI